MMESRIVPFLALVSAIVMAACATRHVDLEGKECPCELPYQCELATNTCVRSTVGDCEIEVEGFGWDWVTPSSIRYSWRSVGDLDAFVQFEVEMAQSVESLGTEAAWLIGPDANPELGHAYLPRTGSGDDPVESTLVRDLMESTAYAARLRVTDRNGCTHLSPTTVAQTSIGLPTPITLFGGPDPIGRAYPTGEHYQLVDDGEGGPALEYRPSLDSTCSERAGVCSQNISWSEIEEDTAGITRGQFDLAILTLELTNDTNTPSFYSRLWIRLPGLPSADDSSSHIFVFQPLTLPTGGPHTIEVPLRELVDDCPETDAAGDCVGGPEPLTWERLNPETADGRVSLPVTQVNFGGQFSWCTPEETEPCTDGRILVHDAQIRY
jgi:hypothetical protein